MQGRERELQVLIGALDDAQGGQGSVHLVLGEAGLGKSTLLAATIAEAQARGVTVLRAQCSEDPTAPALWPWSVLLRGWAADRAPRDLAERLWRAHPLVRRLAPEVAEAAGLEVPAGAADELEGRFVIGDGLGRLLADDGPTLLVLEDLHHADAGTRSLAEPAAAAAMAGGATVLASSRTRAGAGGLASLAGAVMVELAPLDDTPAAAVVASVAPDLDPATVAAIVARADGNPFFLTELARLATNPAAGTTTPALQDVARRRIEVLSPDAPEVLEVAALLGPAPDLDLLARVVERHDVVDKVIDAALDARLLVADGPGARWAHDLLRDAVVDGMGASRCRRVHAAIAEVHAARGEADPFTLAHHLLAAGGATVEAADAGERAARLAAAAPAHEQVLAWVERTLPVAARLPDGGGRRARLDDLAGRAAVGLGDNATGRARLIAAAERFLTDGDVRAAAEALLAIGTGRLRGTEEVEPPLELLDAVLDRVQDDGLRSRLVGRRSDLVRDRTGCEALMDEAIDLGRRSGDPDVLIPALARRLITWRSDPLEVRRPLLDEIEALVPAASPELRFETLAYRALVLLEEGRLDELERLLPTVAAAVLRLGVPQAVGFEPTSTMLHVLRGRFDDAEEALASLVAGARGAYAREALVVQGLQTGIVNLLRGELGLALERADAFLAMAAGTPLEVQVHCVRCLAAATAGLLEVAWASVDEVFRAGVEPLLDVQFDAAVGLVAFVGEAVALLGDADRAAALEELLLPWQGRWIVGGMAPVLSMGSSDHVLGLLARARGDLALARRRLTSAVASHRTAGAPPLLARSQLAMAQLLVEAGEEDAAESAAREAGRLAARYGLRVIAEHAARILAALGAAPVRGATVGGTPAAIVFTDIESSTATAAALGDEAWLAKLRAHDALVRRVVAAHGGREVKHLGDGFLLAFTVTASAVSFARELQAALADGPLRVRAGVHTGPVVEDAGDVFGTTVNVAARVCGAAAGGEVLVTEAVRAVTPDLALGPARTANLKGVPDPVRLHPLA